MIPILEKLNCNESNSKIFLETVGDGKNLTVDPVIDYYQKYHRFEDRNLDFNRKYQRILFSKYDSDGDGILTKEEALTFVFEVIGCYDDSNFPVWVATMDEENLGCYF